MPLPDKHEDEPVAEIDALKEKYLLLLHAEDSAKRWKEYADSLKKELMEAIGNNYAGTIDGTKVIGYRPIERWATARIMNDYPDLARHYFTDQPQFDIEKFRAQHPEIAAKYQSRQFRILEEL